MFPCLWVESDRLHVSLCLLRLSLFIKSLCYLKEVPRLLVSLLPRVDCDTDGLSTNRDKNYHMPTVKYTAGSLMLSVLDILFQMHGIMDSIKYQQIKNLNLTVSVRNLIMGRGWIFHQDNNPKHQNQHKNGSLITKWSFYHGSPSPLTWTLQKMSGVNFKRRSTSIKKAFIMYLFIIQQLEKAFISQWDFHPTFNCFTSMMG